ncbi:hypothetical protein [Yoonia sp. SS1-5]|uniref:Uncharacterized protein n=1 Tax=Yoonia rhodophyticola TaxID=3137370 RepID=A0AAN0MEZ8_9RHOB
MPHAELLNCLVVRFGVSVRLFLVAIAIIWFSMPALAQEDEWIPFNPDTGAPLKLSVFQEIPEFRSHLYRLDLKSNLIDKGDEWTPMVDADIWVFLLKSRADAIFLPEIVLDPLKDYYEGTPAFAITGNMSINGMVGERLMFFVFLEDFGEDDFGAIGCDVATLLYSKLGGNELADVQAAQVDCYDN